jgi:short-subunit dehydrogenase
MSKSPGPQWERALVTGASSGIGRSYALHLGAAGVDLVLVARNRDRLEEVADRCRTDHGVDVEILAADLADGEQLERVAERLTRTPPVDLLVNNAGIRTFGLFHTLPLAGELRELDVNVRAVVRLAHAAIGAMSERGSGTVLNVSSMLGLQPAPSSAMYAATKAFVTNFSQALHEEVRGAGVTVTVVISGLVRTEFMVNAGQPHRLDGMPSAAWLAAAKVVEVSLRDASRGRAVSVPGWAYRASAALMSVTPPSLLRRFGAESGRRLPVAGKPG